jgi:hypothetical protein
MLFIKAILCENKNKKTKVFSANSGRVVKSGYDKPEINVWLTLTFSELKLMTTLL